MSRPKYLPDNFTLALTGTVVFASLLPCRGETAVAVGWLTNFAIGLLFFLHGAKLQREAIVSGITHWRLHGLVLLTTFILFPLFGLAFKPILSPLVTPTVYTGVLFLCTLSSTIQSSIAFTSMAKGNVPAAICSASASSLLGIFITPVLVTLIIANHGASGSAWQTVGDIVLQLLVPFVAGQLLRPAIGGWIERKSNVIRFVDQGSILLVVYSAFSEGVREGLWHRLPISALGALLLVDGILLATALVATAMISKWLGFERADRMTVIFCGSKKSLAAGLAMAKVMFAPSAVGAIVLPIMLFHQLQLMVCAPLARRWGENQEDERDAKRKGRAVVG